MKRPLIAVALFCLVLTIIRLLFFPNNDGKVKELLSSYVEDKSAITCTGRIKEVRLSENSVGLFQG